MIAEVTPNGERHEYAYDTANNVTAKPGIRSIELRAGNQLLRVDHEEFTYNERHHVSERARANGRWIYSYDSFDQLIQASWKPIGNVPSKEWTAEYDGLGRIGMSMHLGLPHPHAHPPSLNPPAPIPYYGLLHGKQPPCRPIRRDDQSQTDLQLAGLHAFRCNIVQSRATLVKKS